MNRTAARQKLDQERTAGEAKTLAARREFEAAHARYVEWRKPELDLAAAKAKWDGVQAALNRVIDSGEAELRQHAAPVLAAARTRLCDAQQDTRRLLDRGGGGSNTAAVQARLAAIRTAIEQVDALEISGENDLPAAVRRIMSVFSRFETDAEFDLEFAPAAVQRHERFTVVEL